MTVVARRDLTGFRHLHPVMDAGGTWTAPLRLRDAGSYACTPTSRFTIARGRRPVAFTREVSGP